MIGLQMHGEAVLVGRARPESGPGHSELLVLLRLEATPGKEGFQPSREDRMSSFPGAPTSGSNR